jgi:predicted phosphoribosyltransferase
MFPNDLGIDECRSKSDDWGPAWRASSGPFNHHSSIINHHSHPMTFRDRTEAGRRLAAALAHLAGRDDLLVLALPRGGVPVAAEVARALGAPLDLCFAHKIGAPHNPEFAIGSVAETGAPYIDGQAALSLRIPYSYIQEEAAIQQADLARRAMRYRGSRPPPVIAGKCVILIDDGVATGSTAHAALLALRGRNPSRLIFAAPVAAAETLQRLAADADELAILDAPRAFCAVGEFYDRFPQVSDEEVVSLLASCYIDGSN